MKKKLVKIVLLLAITLFPLIANAEEIDLSQYETLNLEEALSQEKITKSFKDYKESDDQVTIYLFRGNGCGFCRAFLTYLNSIADEYGRYFKLVSFEVWQNKDNSQLLEKVGKFTGEEADGVPYIIIGEQVFPGYIESWNADILKAITTEYDKENRYDIFDAMNNIENNTEAVVKEPESKNNTMPIIVTIIAINIISTSIILYNQNKNKEELMKYIKIASKKSKANKKTNSETISESNDNKKETE